MPSDIDRYDGNVRIAGYEAFQRIGSGGFSSVYRARQSSLGRDVAVKVLSADFSSEADRRTFERECHALGLLSRHPNIVTVYSEAFTDEGRPCIVMELYHGNYRERLDERGPLPVAELLSLGVKIAGALQVAHDGGVLHRDLKPHNIFMSDYGEPALGDFGISTLDDERSISAQSGLSVAYAAPEVLEDSSATSLSDTYSLAATLYHLCEGSAPFASKQMRATVKRILTEEAASLSRSDAPVALSHVLRTGLAKNPADRFPSAEAFAEALRGVQAHLGIDRTEIPLRRSGSTPAATTEVASSESTTTVRRPSAGGPDQRLHSEPVANVDGRGTKRQPPRRRVGPEPELGDRSAEQPMPHGEHTVLRPRSVPAAEPGAPAAEVDESPSIARTRLAMVLGALSVIGVVVMAFVLTNGGDDATATTTTAVTVVGNEADQEFFAPVDPPTGIEIIGEAGGATLEISFDPADDAVTYEAESVAPSLEIGLRASADVPTIMVDASVDEAQCWIVRTLGGGGRQSRPSETVCHLP